MDLREVDLRIVDERVLILGIASLPSELREAADRRADETTCEGWIERLIGNREAVSRLADGRRQFPVVAIVAAEPEFQDRGRAGSPGESGHALLRLNVDIAVGVAARRARNIRRAEDTRIELAIARENVSLELM